MKLVRLAPPCPHHRFILRYFNLLAYIDRVTSTLSVKLRPRSLDLKMDLELESRQSNRDVYKEGWLKYWK